MHGSGTILQFSAKKKKNMDPTLVADFSFLPSIPLLGSLDSLSLPNSYRFSLSAGILNAAMPEYPCCPINLFSLFIFKFPLGL